MIGTCVSHYRIVEKLGAGGMGEVFVAEDTLLARRVAIKFPAPDADGGNPPSRLLSEARAASKLEHPNIARIYDCGETAEGRPFLVMELVNGVTLYQTLKSGALPPARSIAIVESVLLALGEAHRHGMVHRDIKPANVMLSASGEVKVLDFGLAKEIAPPADGPVSQAATAAMGETAPGVTRGTPQYMSPEQAHGALLDGRSDLFSAGLLLYECVTGRPAFHGETGRAMLEQVAYADPPPPSSRVTGLPASIDRITAKALAKNAADRYQSADEMLADLARASERLEARFPRILGWPFTGRRLLWTGAAIVAVAVAAGWFGWRARPHEPPPEAMHWYDIGAAALRDGTFYRAAKALEKAVELDPEFALARARLAEARNELDDPAGADRALLRALPAAGAAKLRRTDALYIDAIHRTLIRDFAGAIRAYTTLAAGAAPAERATVYVDLGRVREATQETGKALEAYREAIRLDPQNAAAHLRAAILLSRRREPDAAVEFAAADSLYQALSNTEGQAEVFYQRGYSAARDDRRAEARALLEKAVQLAKAISSDQQEIAATLQLGFLADLDGDPAKAEEIAGAAVERARRTGMAYFAARGLAAVGEAQFLKREYKRAEANLQEALEISRKSQMPRSEARALFGLANLHQTIGRPEAAIREIDLAIAYYQNAGFKIETLTARMIKARAARDLGRETEAIEAFQDALPLATALGDRRYMGIAEQGIASVLSLQENWPAALPHYARYYEIASGSADPNAIGRALAGQAGALWRLGRSMEAEGKLAELGGLKMTRVAAEQLSAWIAQQRIEIALQIGRQGEAAAVARRLREIKAGDTSDLAADLAMARCAGGVALALTGAVREGKDLCEQGLAALSGEADRLLLAVAQIQMAQILLHNGESGPALEQAKRACDALGGATRPESLWRAWVIAARAYRVAGERVHAAEALETAKARLADLRRSWPADEFNSYEKRTDISQLLSDFQR